MELSSVVVKVLAEFAAGYLGSRLSHATPKGTEAANCRILLLNKYANPIVTKYKVTPCSCSLNVASWHRGV